MIYLDSFNLNEVKTLLVLEGKTFYLLKKYGENFKTVLKTNAYIGKNGFSDNKKEGDGKTPLGIYKTVSSFGLSKKPKTNLPYLRANKNFYYVTDCNSVFYNKLVSVKNVEIDWKCAERIIDYPKEYSFAVIIDYNSKCEKCKGSAILLHCKGDKEYTSGCVAIDKADMITVLKYIDKNTYIVIGT